MNVYEPGAIERKALDKIQADIAACLSDIQAIEAEPLTIDEATVRLRSFLSGFKTDHVESYFIAGIRHSGSMPDLLTGPLSLVLWAIGPELVVSRAKKFWEASGNKGINSRDQKKSIDALRAKLDELELAEELEASRLERDSSAYVMRRQDVRGDILIKAWQQAA